MTNTFDWIEIRSRNIEATADFYERLFGWKVTQKVSADELPVWLFDTGSQPRLENLRRGGIWLRPDDEPVGFVVYILVEDIDLVLGQVTELGGKIVSQKTPQSPTANRAYCCDPDGNLFGLWEEKKEN